MKKLHKFILKSYIGPFILTFFIAQFLLLMQFLWKYIDELVGKGLDFSVIAELMLYASATLVPMALPLAVLLSSIMTFGNLAENNELMAIKSAGINLFRIMLPLIVFSIFVSYGAFLFSNHVMPYTNLKMGTLLYDVRKQKPEISIKEGVFSDALEGYVIKVASKNKNTSMLYNLMIYNHTEKNGNRKVTIADSATMKLTSDNKYIILTMYHGTSYDEILEKNKSRNKKKYPHQLTTFTKQRILIDMSGLGFKRTDENLFKHNYQMLNLSQLETAIDSLNKNYDKRKSVFITNLETRNFFKKLNYSQSDSNWFKQDKKNLEHLNIDSLFNSLPLREKHMVFENAKSYIRNSQSYVSSIAGEFSGKQKWIRRHEIEWHRKFTLAFACLLLFFIGAPLGAIIRKGGLGMPVVISVLFFVIYYVITISGEKAAKVGNLSVWFGMWLSAMILFPLGIFLTYKAATDSVILNIDTYLKPIKKLFEVGKKAKKKIKEKRTSEHKSNNT